MKKLTCEMCGSTDLVKEGGVFVCQSCGCKYSVEEAKKMMIERTGCKSVADFQRLTPVNREKAIQKLRKEHLSLRQISRLTGVSLMIIRRIVEK